MIADNNKWCPVFIYPNIVDSIQAGGLKFMSIIGKILGAAKNTQYVKLANRFLDGCFETMGAVERSPRTNTVEEITRSIKAYASENPEIAEFAKDMKDMNPEHLGLAQDVIDLSKHRAMLPTNIDFNQKTNTGQSIMGHILKMLPKVSRENPAALDLTQSVINHSDSQNAKYFLLKLFGHDIAKMNGLSEQMKAVKEVVPTIAKDTLSGGYTMDYSKNQKFFDFIKLLCLSDSKPENIKLLKKIADVLDTHNPGELPHTCDLNAIRTGDTDKIRKNLEILPQVLEKAEKPVNVSEFLTHNESFK